MKKLILALSLVVMVFVIAACGEPAAPTRSNPTISGATAVTIFVGDEFDPMEGVTAEDHDGVDITTDIVVTLGTFDADEEGVYTIVYTVEDSQGLERIVNRTVTVTGYEFAEGWYDYKFADSDLRHYLFSRAERFLLETMAGGIPMYANAGFTMYSSRLQLPVEDYIPVMGFGTMFSTMSEDDSNVLMEDGLPGNVGEYTYRSHLIFNPDTLHHWEYQDAVSSDVMTLFLDSMYYFDFNDAMDGFEVLPSMADAMPTLEGPFDQDIFDSTGNEVGNIWHVPLKNNLTWTYHESVDVTGFDAGHEEINAHDFVNTYRKAMEEGWFRAVAGGGDFQSAPQEIVGAAAFIADPTPENWDNVGLRVVDDYTIEFEFVGLMDEWNVVYYLASFVMTPINFAIYDSLADPSLYGTSVDTIAFNGRFMMTYYEEDVIIRYEANPNFHDPERTFFTHWTFKIHADSTVAFEDFLDGRLEAIGVPGARFEEFQDDIRLRRVPGVTIFRMNLNALDTPENQDEHNPGSEKIPSPLVGNVNFRYAMYFIMDREEIAYDILVTSEPAMHYFTTAYLVDPAGGVAFRDTEFGPTVGEGFAWETYGYAPDAAVALYELAVDELVTEGRITPGTLADPTIMPITYVLQAGVETLEALGNYIKELFEDNFYCDTHHVGVEVELIFADFPDNYFSYIIPGESDLGMGGISGSTLDASSFLRQFASDNRGGLTLNWGPDFDTSVPSIELDYIDPSTGDRILELWSYDALVSALNGSIYLEGGMEATPPEE